MKSKIGLVLVGIYILDTIAASVFNFHGWYLGGPGRIIMYLFGDGIIRPTLMPLLGRDLYSFIFFQNRYVVPIIIDSLLLYLVGLVITIIIRKIKNKNIVKEV